MRQFQLTVFKLKIRPTDKFPPFARLHNPAAVLEIRFARLCRFVIFNKYAFIIHTNGIMCMSADNHIKSVFIQIARQIHITRRIGTVFAVIIIAHMGQRNFNIRLFFVFQLRQHAFCRCRRIFKMNQSHIFGIAQLRRIFRSKSHHGNF